MVRCRVWRWGQMVVRADDGTTRPNGLCGHNGIACRAACACTDWVFHWPGTVADFRRELIEKHPGVLEPIE